MNRPSHTSKPPGLAQWLLGLLLNSEEKATILGDLAERYAVLAAQTGPSRAKSWYWIQSLKSIAAISSHSLFWSLTMLRNYCRIALRNMARHKSFSLINLSGLAIGMAAAALILLFVQDELRYDRYHENASRIYRLVNNGRAHVGVPWAPAIKEQITGVEHAVRILDSPGGPTKLIRNGQLSFVENRFFYGDSEVFEVFTWPLVMGDPKTALRDPFTLVLTQSMARKYFGNDNPLGKVLRVDGDFEFQITGVVQDLPPHSHMHFNLLASMATVLALEAEGEWGTPMPWDNRFVDTYLLLETSNNPELVETQLPHLLSRHLGEEYRGSILIDGTRLQPITDIHLSSGVSDDFDPQGSTFYIYFLTTISAFILLIACINFMNLSTARSRTRAREAGLRKVFGAWRAQLMRQFLGEALMMSLIGLIIALGLVFLLLPSFSALTGKNLTIDYLRDWPITVGFIVMALGVGIVSGSYPAFFLSAFRPAVVLRGMAARVSRGAGLRRFLVVFQFGVSILLMIGTLVIYRQIEYLHAKDLGFDKEQIIVLPFRGSDILRDKAEVFKQEVLKHPRVRQASISHSLPGHWLNGFSYLREGLPRDQRVSLGDLVVDHDFIDTYGIEIMVGRSFSAEIKSDSAAFVINESAVQALGWGSPQEAVGQRMSWLMGNEPVGTIIGVVRDFHFRSLHTQIPPMVMHMTNWSKSFLSVRITSEEIAQSLSFLQSTWQSLEPAYPFQYYFLDQEFARNYEAEERLGRICGYFALLAILIGCLGLFGLAAFMAHDRKKEMGMRKVLGATVTGLVLLQYREFGRLILAAFAIASPLAYLATEKWLENFAYRTSVTLDVFLWVAMTALAIAWLAVGYQAIRTALSNPIDSLRYE